MYTKRNDNDTGAGSAMTGGMLVLLGSLFLILTQGIFNLNWGNFWPALPTVAGLYVLTLAALSRDPARRAGLVLGGTAPFLIGLFLFATTLGFIGWDMQARLWPVYPLIMGVAFFAAYFTSGQHKVYLLPAIILTVVGGGFLPFAYLDTNYEYTGRLWPLAPIVIGLALILSRVVRTRMVDSSRS